MDIHVSTPWHRPNGDMWHQHQVPTQWDCRTTARNLAIWPLKYANPDTNRAVHRYLETLRDLMDAGL